MGIIPRSMQNTIDKDLVTDNPIKRDVWGDDNHSEMELVKGTIAQRST